QAPASDPVTVGPANAQGDFLVSWNAADEANGSGVKHVTVYVSTDNGDYRIWQRQAPGASGAAVFDGTTGHTYKFLALATDYAGNREVQRLGETPPPDDGTRTNLGGLPVVGPTTPASFGQPPAPTAAPSTNPLFTPAEP